MRVYTWRCGEGAAALGLSESVYRQTQTDFGVREAQAGRPFTFWMDQDGVETWPADAWWRLARVVDTPQARRFTRTVDSQAPYLRLLPAPAQEGAEE
jgi:hypothetical protein